MSNENSLQLVAYRIFNGFAPREKPKSLKIILDFTIATLIDVDLFKENSQGKLQFVQSMYIDNYDNNNPLSVVFSITGQRIIAPAKSQGVYPVLAPDQTAMKISTTPVAEGLMIPLHL